MKDKYSDLILKNCARLFSAINQDKLSSSYGCLDRNYWHYKIEKDFPSSVFQTGALSLALLYKHDFPGNIFYKQKKVLDLAIAAIPFWTKIQNHDGSFSEWYPNERSHVATAFTSYAISEALLVLGSEVPEKERQNTLRVLEKTGDYLNKNPETVVANHQAGAIMALYNIYLLSGKQQFKAASKKQLKILLNGQSTEGWFPEYSGADLGYLSLTVSFLAEYWKKTKDEQVLSSLKKAVDFMSYFLHPDGTYGGEYGSRGTKFLITNGLAILSPRVPKAKYVLENYKLINPYDDRYLIFFFLTDWIKTYIQTQNRELRTKNQKKFGQADQFDQSFPNAGIRVVKNKNYYGIVSYQKNGVIKVFKNDKLVFSDTGWWGRTNDNKIVSSQWLDARQTSSLITSEFCRIEELKLGGKIVLFRLFNYTLGKIGFFSWLVDFWIKRKYLKSVKKTPVVFKREITFKPDKVFIDDEISLPKDWQMKSLIRTTNFCQKYTPTSYFFTPADLFCEKGQDIAKILNKRRKIKIIKTV